MKKLFGFSSFLVSTVCGNHCSQCPYAHFTPQNASMNYMAEVANYLQAHYVFPVLDVTGRDITTNPHLLEFLALCKSMHIRTSVTLGTPRSVTLASEIFRLVKYPRISLDGASEVDDDYRGSRNFDSFVSLMDAAKEARILKRLRVIFTPVPGMNTDKESLIKVLKIVRELGKNKAKLMINPLNTGGYSQEEIKRLIRFGKEAIVEFSLAKQWLLGQTDISKGCSCRAKNVITFGPNQALLAPCALLRTNPIPINHNGIEGTLASSKYQTAMTNCGNHPSCNSCRASCYHIPGRILDLDLPFILRHILSLPSLQGARDVTLAWCGKVRLNPKNRFPNCPQIR